MSMRGTAPWAAELVFALAMVVVFGALRARDTAAPGLPWLNTGAMAGYGVGLVVMVV